MDYDDYHTMNPLARRLDKILNESKKDWEWVAETIGCDLEWLWKQIHRSKLDVDLYHKLKELIDINQGI